MSEPRTYCLGLPVVITVHDDGRVEFSVDASEASDLWEAVGENAPPDDVVEADIARVDVAVTHSQLPAVTLPAPTQENPDA